MLRFAAAFLTLAVILSGCIVGEPAQISSVSCGLRANELSVGDYHSWACSHLTVMYTNGTGFSSRNCTAYAPLSERLG